MQWKYKVAENGNTWLKYLKLTQKYSTCVSVLSYKPSLQTTAVNKKNNISLSNAREKKYAVAWNKKDQVK